MPRAGRGGLAPTHGLVAWALATRPPRCPVPSRPSTAGKEHYLALETGRELETRGWVVGMTTLRQQPAHRVGPHDGGFADPDHLLQRSGASCRQGVRRLWDAGGSVNVGDVARWLPEACIAADRSPIALADACERVLSTDWGEQPSCCLTGASVQPWNGRGSICFAAPETDRSGGFIGFRTIVDA